MASRATGLPLTGTKPPRTGTSEPKLTTRHPRPGISKPTLGTSEPKSASEPPTVLTLEQLPTARGPCETVGEAPATGPKRHTIVKRHHQTASYRQGSEPRRPWTS